MNEKLRGWADRLKSVQGTANNILLVRRRIDWLYLALLGLSPVVLILFCEWFGTSGSVPSFLRFLGQLTGMLPLMLTLLMVFQCLSCIVLVPLSLIPHPAQRRRVAYLMMNALSIVAINCGFRVTTFVIRVQMKAFADRSQPLITAIETFEGENKRPPKALSELVPKYLPEIPHTGMAAYPKYHYRGDKSTPQVFYGNPWRVSVSSLRGPADVRLYYLPKQNYPVRSYGGEMQRVGKWAYVFD